MTAQELRDWFEALWNHALATEFEFYQDGDSECYAEVMEILEEVQT